MTLGRKMKLVLKKIIPPLGIEILLKGRSILLKGRSPSPSSIFSLLQHYQLQPKTVFDIGVAEGTPWLYEALPRAKYFLVDPTRESLPFMNRLASQLNAEVMNFALGDVKGTQRIFVRSDIGGSTLFEEVGEADVRQVYDIAVRRFDEAMPDFDRPTLCKIDVQGAEISVIRGMGKRIEEIDCFIIETSLIATIKAGPEFSELFFLMKESDFVVFDIVGMVRRPLDGALAQMDVVFVRSNAALRSDKRWSG